MKTIDRNDIDGITKIIKPILWDYKIDAYQFYLTIRCDIKSAGGNFDFKKAFIRRLKDFTGMI